MDKLPQYAALKHLMFKSFNEILQKNAPMLEKKRKYAIQIASSYTCSFCFLMQMCLLM